MNRPQRLALIGHRGVGKTSLLARLMKAGVTPNRNVIGFDLDREIEARAGRSVSDLFRTRGEADFRHLELTTLAEIESSHRQSESDVVIALGAGFQVEKLDRLWRAVWIQRPTDQIGRVFTDRPRLDLDLTPLDEFRTRAAHRAPKFAARADDVLILNEGHSDTSEDEIRFFQDQIDAVDGALTLLPENFAHDFQAWISRRLQWGVRWFELRDDLLSVEQMKLAAQLIPGETLLVSFRDRARETETLAFAQALKAAIDWPAERDVAPAAVRALLSETRGYLSLHQRPDKLEDAFAHLQSVANGSSLKSVQLKAALHTESFRELMIGHRWQNEDPAARVFLPMSKDGRWNWYRQLRARDFSLNFFRESAGSAPDQPTLLQWIRRQRLQKSKSPTFFAAVLGDPVEHSRTPTEQAEFFARHQMSVFAIRVTDEEWSAGALTNLIQLGLRAAAVTAPLKRRAFELFETSKVNVLVDPTSDRLASVNTLFIDTTGGSQIIHGTNTDLEGLRRAVERHLPSIEKEETLIWGGGGTLEVLSDVFPKAQKVSVRTRRLRGTDERARAPSLLIWAANLKDDATDPPDEWRPQIVFDLNYSEASAARTYAMKVGARYISGLAMFESQAQAQREFWIRCGLDTGRLK